jgi:hypothetical protein
MGFFFNSRELRRSKHADLWFGLIAAAVMVALTASLATRFFHVAESRGSTVHSDRSVSVRQHMDRDAMRWAAPTAQFAIYYSPIFYPWIGPTAPRVRMQLLEETLSNRPPPSC